MMVMYYTYTMAHQLIKATQVLLSLRAPFLGSPNSTTRVLDRIVSSSIPFSKQCTRPEHFDHMQAGCNCCPSQQIERQSMAMFVLFGTNAADLADEETSTE